MRKILWMKTANLSKPNFENNNNNNNNNQRVTVVLTGIGALGTIPKA